MNLTELFRLVVSLSLIGSLLVIGLLIIKTLLREKLSANWHYYIWFLLILRLMVPFTSPVPFSVFNFIPHNQQTSYLSQAAVPHSEGTAATAAQSNENTINITSGTFNANNKVQYPAAPATTSWFNWQALSIIWILGVMAIFLYILFINGLLLFKIKRLPVCTSDNILNILQQCRSDLKLHANISVVYDHSLKSPGLFGISCPKIIISPEIIKKLSPEELRYIFLHELSHLKRRDLLINMIVLAIQIVYWFNPLIWYALSQMKQDCEMACDATALAAITPENHRSYGQTIINLLQMLSEPKWAPGILGFVSKFNTRRIIMISAFRKTTAKWAIVTLALLFVAGCSSLNNPFDTKGSTESQKTVSTSSQQDTKGNTPSVSNAIVYKNTVYGFNFTLPLSWQGYSLITGEWEGNETMSGTITETGQMISIRHPQWSSAKPRQDIPIMIFTLDQWNLLQQEKFYIGAAPIGPSKLGGNGSYVFALPARYNYAFPAGYEEVEKILNNNPLQTINIKSDSATAMLLNMMQRAKQGKVINCEFPVKTSNLGDVERKWGKADNTAWIQATKGTYSTYLKKDIAFGWNKGMQIFEVRSFDSRLKTTTLAKVKEVFGTPAWDSKINNQEIFGYTAGEFKIELVFPQPAGKNLNPGMDHYNVLYPDGTVNSMANDPGRKW